MSKTHANNPSTSNPENARLRSKTYSGIAHAIALQYTAFMKYGMSVGDWEGKLSKLNIKERQDLYCEYVQL